MLTLKMSTIPSISKDNGALNEGADIQYCLSCSQVVSAGDPEVVGGC